MSVFLQFIAVFSLLFSSVGHANPSCGRALLGTHPRIEEVRNLIARFGRFPFPVLVTGETGTGKEIVARMIHEASGRRGRFIAVNVAAVVPGLAESEFFGHERGAFTGAVHTNEGYFAAANGGTLFLDEIGEMSPDLQAKLLRVLEEGTVRRVGGTQSIPVNVRIISATNRNLLAEVRAGRFREDLYYRLAVLPISTSPLRDWPEDIPVLAHHFLGMANEATRNSITGIRDDAMALLVAHPWPGNVRELKNVIERAVALCDGAVLTPRDIQFDARRRPGETASQAHTVESLTLDTPGVWENLPTMPELEAWYLSLIFRETGESTVRTSEITGLSMRKIQYDRNEGKIPGNTSIAALVFQVIAALVEDRPTWENLQHRYFELISRLTRGNTSDTADILGVSQRTIQNWNQRRR